MVLRLRIKEKISFLFHQFPFFRATIQLRKKNEIKVKQYIYFLKEFFAKTKRNTYAL